MQRKRVQGRKPVRRPRKKKVSRKPPVSFSEMVLNWIIVVLAAVILFFFASLIWRIFFSQTSDRTNKPIPPDQAQFIQKIMRVEVLNGCGEKGVAGKVTDILRSKGFDVVYTGNYRRFDVDSSFIMDRRSMKKVYGNRLAQVLGISPNRVEPILSDELDLEVSLIVGKDYRLLIGIQ